MLCNHHRDGHRQQVPPWGVKATDHVVNTDCFKGISPATGPWALRTETRWFEALPGSTAGSYYSRKTLGLFRSRSL